MIAVTDERSWPQPPGQTAKYHGRLFPKLAYYWRLRQQGWKVRLRDA